MLELVYTMVFVGIFVFGWLVGYDMGHIRGIDDTSAHKPGETLRNNRHVTLNHTINTRKAFNMQGPDVI